MMLFNMTKVFPNASFNVGNAISVKPQENNPLPAVETSEESVLTVWKKSLLFNCNGFTVFNSKGALVFRVDNYMDGNKGEIVLMDADGKPLLTIHRKKLSLGDNWLVYQGETTANPLFAVKKSVNILNNKCLAHVNSRNKKMMYEIEGSYSQRNCAVYDDQRRIVAEIKQKETIGGVAFGTDVFRLIVQPDCIETESAMALLILLDQMFGSSKR